MPIQYAGGTNYNMATVCDTKADLCTAIDTALNTTGWITTTTTSSTDHIYQCATTPQTNQIKVRVWEGTNCVRIRMMNTAETISQIDSCYLYVATNTTYRIIANQYQFESFVPGSISSRNFVIASAMYIPPHLETMGLTTCSIILGDGHSDTDTTNLTGGFRRSMTARGFLNATGAQGWTLLNSTAVEYNNLTDNITSYSGMPSLATIQSACLDSISGFRWHDDSALIVEPLVAWGAPNILSESKIRGQLWDAFIATESYPADITTVVDSHTFYNLTDNNDGTSTLPSSMRGSLFVVVP